MLLSSHRKIVCPFWLFREIFVISLPGVLNFVRHCRDIYAPCLVAIAALPNATFDWPNLLNASVFSSYDSDPMIFDPNWRYHVIVVECLSLSVPFHLGQPVVSSLVCFYDMLTGFVDDFLNGSNFNLKNNENWSKISVFWKVMFSVLRNKIWKTFPTTLENLKTPIFH